MLLRVLPLLIALALSLAPSSQAAVFVAAPPASASPSTSENACTAFLEDGSEARIGLLCHNDPVNKTDPMGLRSDGPEPGAESEGMIQGAAAAASVLAVPVAIEQGGAALLALASRVPIVARFVGPAVALGNKVSYMLGEASGNPHTDARTAQMASQLARIGLQNTPSTRAYLTKALTQAASQKGVVQENGRVVRETLLMGPNGGLKMQSVWEGKKLITAQLYGK